MAISRGKRYIQGVPVQNIQVNVPEFNAFNKPIEVAAEIATAKDRQETLDFERQVAKKEETIKNLQTEIKDTNKITEELHNEFLASIEQTHENSLTEHIIRLNEKVFELNEKYPLSPADWDNEFNAYYNSIIENKDAEWLKKPERFLKFAEKHSSLRLSSMDKIKKAHKNKINDQTWSGINMLKDYSINNIKSSIANIDTIDELSNYLVFQEETIQLLNDRLGIYQSFNFDHGKTPEDFNGILADYVAERDEAFLSHILTNFVLKDVTEGNIQVANMLLDYYETDQIPKKGDKLDRLIKTIADDWDIKTLDGFIDILRENTSRYYEGNPILNNKQREDIIKNARTAIEQAVTTHKENISYDVKKIEGELKIAQTTANENLSNLSSKIYNRTELEGMFQNWDDKSNSWVLDEEAIENYELKQQIKIDAQDLITEAILGNLSNEEIYQRASVIDFKTIGIEGKPRDIIDQYTVKLAFGNQELDVVSLTQNVFDEDAMFSDVNLMNGLNVMKSTEHMPKEFLEYFDGARNFTFEEESTQKHIVGMAIIKNYAFGKSAPLGMDADINEALNNVFSAYDKSKGNFAQASATWKLRLHPKHEVVQNNLENFDEWFEKEGIKTRNENQSGYDWVNNLAYDLLNRAVDREDWTSLRSWAALLDTLAWSGDKSGERTFDNLVLNKDTVGILDWWQSGILYGIDHKGQNMSLATSVSTMLNEYIEDNIHKHLNQEDMKSSDFYRALRTVAQEGVNHMSNNPDVTFSSILHVPNNPNGIVVTDKAPERLILNGQYDKDIIMQNANAFIGKLVMEEFNNNPNEASQMWFNLPADSVPIEDWEEFERNYMSLWKNNKIKLHPVQDTLDTDNPAWNIMIDWDGDGLWTTVTKDRMPVEWYPNAQFTNASSGYSYDETIDHFAELLMDGRTIIKSSAQDGWSTTYNLKDFTESIEGGFHWSDAFRQTLEDIKTPEDRQTFKNLLKQAIKGEKTIFESMFAGSKWVDETEINTISEMQTILANRFNDFNKSIQKQLDFSFAEEQEITLYNHNMKYHSEKFKNAKDEKEMIEISNQHINQMTDLYNETYSIDNAGVIIPPVYAFVIKDIMASTDDWKNLVGEGTAFHSEIINQNFRYAKNKLMRMKSYFVQEGKLDQFNAWLNLWDISFNKL